ncbi:MAG: polyprenol monophosphomannose synthase [Fibromonadales bacterium]|nr:polyprenol monophosphomannose synthase [Fibromonadales bacterium]MCL1957686.1 polyprenol monophosphomannose synthase [Fibromonadales bacterium]
MKFLIIIPTYNEMENIPEIIPHILAQNENLEILVVDDGSPDGTGDFVDNLSKESGRIHLLRREKKMGLGTAYVAGFKWALEKDYDRIFEMDADGSHSPQALNIFLKEAESADLVLGSRYLNGKISVVHWDWKRLILSYCANFYTRFVTGMPFYDATGGFKCFSREALQNLDLGKLKSDGYCFQIETTHMLWKKGLKIKEIPIIFTDRTKGSSKMSGGIISEAFFLVLKLRFRS